MDLTSDTGHLPVRDIIIRAIWFFGYLIAFMGVMAMIGLIPTVAAFVVFFMRYEARERWSLVIPYAVTLVVFIWFAFDYFMAIPWPPTFIGQWFPVLKVIPSVNGKGREATSFVTERRRLRRTPPAGVHLAR